MLNINKIFVNIFFTPVVYQFNIAKYTKTSKTFILQKTQVKNN